MMQPISTGGTDDDSQRLTYFMTLIAPQAAQLFQVFTIAFQAILSWICAPLEVFLRYDFGERYMSPSRLFLGWQFMMLFMLIVGLLGDVHVRLDYALGTGEEVATNLNVAFVNAFLLLSLLHLWRIWYRNRKGKYIYSRSFGVSWLDRLGVTDIMNAIFSLFQIPVIRFKLPLVMDDWALYRFWEPGIAFAVAHFIRDVDAITGTFLLSASVALFLQNNLVYFTQRNLILDQRDARIIGKYLNEATRSNKFKWETDGFTVAPGLHEIALPTPDIQATVSDVLSSSGETPAFHVNGTNVAHPGRFSGTLNDMLEMPEGIDNPPLSADQNEYGKAGSHTQDE